MAIEVMIADGIVKTKLVGGPAFPVGFLGIGVHYSRFSQLWVMEALVVVVLISQRPTLVNQVLVIEELVDQDLLQSPTVFLVPSAT